ncbi:MAG: uncharacterized protein KVP18_003841 [Porospora cf. gigantea A]|uniref:uncharacterized protein n=1 Tax=Porospora cf. gigantea A TaxID=2853593 RepID=UPI00355A7687|nr:MAG: hypothetical protein KVP18_003841 [Porospora cf. gigantea A]
MDFTIKSFQEIIPSAESNLPAGVKLCSGSLFLSLSLHSARPAGLNSIVVIDTRFPSSSPPALLNARRLWPDGTTRIGSSERKRIRTLLKNMCDLRTVLLFGTSSCPQSKSRDRFLHLAIDLVVGSGARVKEMLVLAGGIKPYVDHYQGWALDGNAVCNLPVTEIVASFLSSRHICVLHCPRRSREPSGAGSVPRHSFYY